MIFDSRFKLIEKEVPGFRARKMTFLASLEQKNI